MMKIDVLSLFPEMFEGVLHSSIMKKAQENDAVSFDVTDFRDYSADKHHKVDDYPYGGGAGMVLKPEPLFAAVEALSEGSGKAPACHSDVSSRRAIYAKESRRTFSGRTSCFHLRSL